MASRASGRGASGLHPEDPPSMSLTGITATVAFLEALQEELDAPVRLMGVAGGGPDCCVDAGGGWILSRGFAVEVRGAHLGGGAESEEEDALVRGRRRTALPFGGVEEVPGGRRRVFPSLPASFTFRLTPEGGSGIIRGAPALSRNAPPRQSMRSRRLAHPANYPRCLLLLAFLVTRLHRPSLVHPKNSSGTQVGADIPVGELHQPSYGTGRPHPAVGPDGDGTPSEPPP